MKTNEIREFLVKELGDSVLSFWLRKDDVIVATIEDSGLLRNVFIDISNVNNVQVIHSKEFNVSDMPKTLSVPACMTKNVTPKPLKTKRVTGAKPRKMSIIKPQPPVKPRYQVIKAANVTKNVTQGVTINVTL